MLNLPGRATHMLVRVDGAGYGVARCGRTSRTVLMTTERSHVNCKACLRLLRADKRRAG
jgi:hypothetical protein